MKIEFKDLQCLVKNKFKKLHLNLQSIKNIQTIHLIQWVDVLY